MKKPRVQGSSISSVGTELTFGYFANFTVAHPLTGDFGRILNPKRSRVSALGSRDSYLALSKNRREAAAGVTGASEATAVASFRLTGEDL